jgi:hypothetical protein
MSDHRKNIIKKLGLPEWVANAVHEICPSKEAFLLAKYCKDKAVNMGLCDTSVESTKLGFYSDFSFKFKMPYSEKHFNPDNFNLIKSELINIKNSIC